MVGREGLKNACFEATPDRLPTGMIARRRRADIFAPTLVHAQPFEIVCGERNVLRAGVRIDLESTILRPANLLHWLSPGNVHHHHRHVDEFGMAYGAMRGFTFDAL